MNELSKKRINKAVFDVIKESNQINEGWFSDLFGDDYEKYSQDLEKILEKLISNIYYDKDLVSQVTQLYSNVKNSDMDRRDKKELLDIMFGIYKVLEFSKNNLENYMNRLNRLRR